MNSPAPDPHSGSRAAGRDTTLYAPDFGTAFDEPGGSRRWGLVLLRGVFGIVFGLVALLLPGPTLASLILLFAVYLLFDGVVAVLSGIRAARLHRSWGWFLFEGVVDIAVAVITLAWPALSIFVFVWIAAAWALVSGVLMIAAALRWRNGKGRWWIAIAGLVSIVWGVLLFVEPVAGAIAMTVWLGVYALAFGVSLVVSALRLRHAGRVR
jgi:uncharacterized membrane protein HdeD (DUF308 family)